MPTMTAPLFPERHIYTIGERGDTMETLRLWVNGGTFHPYAVPVWQREGFEHDRRDDGRLLKYEGKMDEMGHMRWVVFFRQRGDDGSGTGLCGGYSHPADAAYSALHLIEEDERERYEQELVIGVA